MEKEKLNLTREQAVDLLDGDSEEFKIIKDEIVDTSRWSNIYEIIIQRISDGKYFKDSYSVGATEQQDESPWEYDKPDFTEVFKKEVVTFIYE